MYTDLRIHLSITTDIKLIILMKYGIKYRQYVLIIYSYGVGRYVNISLIFFLSLTDAVKINFIRKIF